MSGSSGEDLLWRRPDPRPTPSLAGWRTAQRPQSGSKGNRADRVEILSGVWDGELVVVGNRSGLQPGQAVEPKMVSMSEAS